MDEPVDLLRFISGVRGDLSAIRVELQSAIARAEPDNPASIEYAVQSIIGFVNTSSEGTHNSPIFSKLKRHSEKKERMIEALVRTMLAGVQEKRRRNEPR